MAEREAALTGALGAGVSSEGSFDAPNRFSPYLFVSTKALDRKLEGALGLVGERLLDCDFSDLKRLKDLLLQKRVHLNGGVVSSGSHYASLHAARGLNGNLALTEEIGGVSRIRFYNHLADHFEEVKEELVAQLRRLHAFILQKARFSASFVGDDKSANVARGRLAELYRRLGGEPLSAAAAGTPTPHPARVEGLAIPTDVSFNAAVFSTVEATHPLAPALYLISQQLDHGYLWDEIRVKRGAYGAKASYSTLNGVFTLSSYRDPCLLETYDVFRSIVDHAEKQMALSQDALEQSIIGAIKHLDRPIRPGDAVELALLRFLRGISDERRTQFRQRLLATTKDDVVKAIATILKPSLGTMSCCSIADKDKLEKAKAKLQWGEMTVEDLLPK